MSIAPGDSVSNGVNPDQSERPHQPGKREKLNTFTVVFIGFMILVGGGILVTQFTGVTHSKSVAGTSAAYSGSQSPAKGSLGPGFSIPATPTPVPVLKIYITGEVKNPGIYTMQTDDRLSDAFDAAGGLTAQADISQFDLAQRVRDEMHINVPKLASPTPVLANSTAPVTNTTPVSINSNSGSNVSLPNSGSTTTRSSSSSGKIGPESGVKINVNTAAATELERLPGVGPTLSQRIVAYRNQHGPFHSLDDLHHVQGVTKTLTDKIKDLIIF